MAASEPGSPQDSGRGPFWGQYTLPPGFPPQMLGPPAYAAPPEMHPGSGVPRNNTDAQYPPGPGVPRNNTDSQYPPGFGAPVYPSHPGNQATASQYNPGNSYTQASQYDPGSQAPGNQYTQYSQYAPANQYTPAQQAPPGFEGHGPPPGLGPPRGNVYAGMPPIPPYPADPAAHASVVGYIRAEPHAPHGFGGGVCPGWPPAWGPYAEAPEVPPGSALGFPQPSAPVPGVYGPPGPAPGTYAPPGPPAFGPPAPPGPPPSGSYAPPDPPPSGSYAPPGPPPPRAIVHFATPPRDPNRGRPLPDPNVPPSPLSGERPLPPLPAEAYADTEGPQQTVPALGRPPRGFGFYADEYPAAQFPGSYHVGIALAPAPRLFPTAQPGHALLGLEYKQPGTPDFAALPDVYIPAPEDEHAKSGEAPDRGRSLSAVSALLPLAPPEQQEEVVKVEVSSCAPYASAAHCPVLFGVLAPLPPHGRGTQLSIPTMAIKLPAGISRHEFSFTRLARLLAGVSYPGALEWRRLPGQAEDVRAYVPARPSLARLWVPFRPNAQVTVSAYDPANPPVDPSPNRYLPFPPPPTPQHEQEREHTTHWHINGWAPRLLGPRHATYVEQFNYGRTYEHGEGAEGAGALYAFTGAVAVPVAGLRELPLLPDFSRRDGRETRLRLWLAHAAVESADGEEFAETVEWVVERYERALAEDAARAGAARQGAENGGEKGELKRASSGESERAAKKPRREERPVAYTRVGGAPASLEEHLETYSELIKIMLAEIERRGL